MIPQRIQLSRKKGWRMPENTVKVDRSTRWGNPFKLSGRFNVKFIRDDCTIMASINEWLWMMFNRENKNFATVTRESLRRFKNLLQCGYLKITVEDVQRELRGKNLACWCKIGEPCHADVLLEIANED